MADEPAQLQVDAAVPRRRRARGCLIDLVAVVGVSIVAYWLVTAFVVQPFRIEQDSMSPTLQQEQYVLVDRLTPHFDGYSRGDIIVFNAIKRDACSDPAGVPLPGSTPYIKRVIGEPGDLIQLQDGDVYVNGVKLSEPYAPADETGPPGLSWVVPQGRLFVMGDNRPGSIDSRSDLIGPVCINDVIGRAVLRYWPINRAEVVQAPTYPSLPPAPQVAPGASPAALPTVSPTATPNSTPSAAETTATPSALPSALQSALPSAGIQSLGVQVIGQRPHDVTSFTEGLVLDDGRLFESSGYAPTLREVDPLTGVMLRSVTMDSQYTGEGIAVVGGRVIQLTLEQHTAFVYELSDFSQVGTFAYDTDGWGLCYDGTRLVMSDGTSKLYFRDPSTFELLGTVAVTNDGAPVEGLNELECVGGKVYANVFPTNTILVIDPSSGHVTAQIDASGLLSADEAPGDEQAVLNGIAYDPTSDTFLLTGKLWPKLFEVRFVPLTPV